MTRRRIEEGEFIAVRVTQQDRQLLESLVIGDPEYVARLRAVPGASDFVGEFTLDDLEDILGHVAAEANHAEDSRRQDELDDLYKRLLRIQRSYDDGNWNDSAV